MNQNFLCRYEHEPPDATDSPGVAWWEEERASLQKSLRTLQTQFASERAGREELEREAELLAGENAALEQQVSGMESCRVGRGNVSIETEMNSKPDGNDGGGELSPRSSS